jgi:hypothetical protein
VVVVGESGHVYSRTFAASAWSNRSGAMTENWLDVVHGGGVFVAVPRTCSGTENDGYGSYIHSVDQGVTWNYTSETAPGQGGWSFVNRRIRYLDGRFVVCHDGTVVVSTGTWSGQTAWAHTGFATSPAADVLDVAYGNGRYVAVASRAGSPFDRIDVYSGATLAGMTLMTSYLMSNGNGGASVAFGSGRFVLALLASSTKNLTVVASPDGVAWSGTLSTVGGVSSIGKMVHEMGMFVLPGDKLRCSVDAVTWAEPVPEPVTAASYTGAELDEATYPGAFVLAMPNRYVHLYTYGTTPANALVDWGYATKRRRCL